MSPKPAFPRIAVVFDQRLRPETTGTYCLRALRKLAQARHVPPDEVGQLDPSSFDLFVRIDDGLREPWPERLRPSVYWAIDTHMDFRWALEEAGRFDLVLAAQRDGAEQLKEGGIESAIWLPLACDAEIHRRHDLPLRWDVSFVGNVQGGERSDLLDLIQQEFPNCFAGRRYFEEMAEVYSQSRIVFNRSIKNDINMRVFEALAAGALLVTNDLRENGLAELFRDEEHLITYRDADDLVGKVRQYLDDEVARARIALAGQREVLAHHTYDDRMQILLKMAERRIAPSIGQPFARGLEEPVANHTNGRPKVRRVNASEGAKSNEMRASFHKPVKDPDYFEFSRPDVLEIVPPTARHVLDVGCGAGRLGEALKRQQDAEVIGIERDETAAESAEARLDSVIRGNVESGEVDFPPGRFDCVICADVLEHLREPDRVLAKIHDWLTPEGVLIASLPNVRHHRVVRSLLAGNWTYETAGLLDEDHVRFFTRREMEKLFYRSGFSIQDCRLVRSPDCNDWEKSGRSPQLTIEGFSFRGRSAEDVEEFFVYQYLFVAQPRAAREFGTTSIVLVTHNQMPYTCQCLDSIRFFTDEPYELIVVDNGSTDGTVAWLKRQPDVQLIENSENRGFPTASNQGIRAANGNQVLLLNNDTLVTTGWLRRLLEALERDSQNGLVGPCSNSVSGPQQVAADYRDLSELDGFAWDLGQTYAGELEEVERLVGFCFLIRREVIDRIGLLDERFGIGCYEDDDYCRRAREAGYRAVIARAAFVHHFGSVTFRDSGLDFAAILEENRLRYEQKWSTGPDSPPRNGHHPTRESVGPTNRLSRHPHGGLLIQPHPIDLSLCMIVRDNEDTIRPCLESIRPWVDEMIVVDTGSTDRTPEICREWGARVEHFPWCDDFSAARNESLKYARGEWIFWMDSDDTIPEECGRGLQSLVRGEHPADLLGYVMQVHCPGGQGVMEDEMTVVDHVKVFRNRPDLRFEFRIHEQVLPAIQRAGGRVEWTDLFVVHSGADRSAEGEQRKLERDLRILKAELAEKPDHPFVLFNIGMTYAHAKSSDEALGYLNRCLDVSGPQESHLRKVFSLIVGAYMQRENDSEALAYCERGLHTFPDDAELQFRAGVLYHRTGRLQEAIDAFQRAMVPKSARRFQSVVRGLDGYLARHNLALVYEDLNRWDEAETQWREVLQDQPESRPAWRGLGQALLKQGKRSDAGRLAAEMPQSSPLRVEGLVLGAQAAAARGDLAEARRKFDEAVACRADADPYPLHEYCRFLFECVDPSEAGAPLQMLADEEPENPSVLANLGTYFRCAGNVEQAVKALQKSVELRPGAIGTRMQLAEMLEAAGQVGASESERRTIEKLRQQAGRPDRGSVGH